jgi:mannose/cellobiose epimerase-like protein (N-acyl-D-glucosamine 2-epimerase family)
MTVHLDALLEGQRLLDFARPAASTPAGFGWLDDEGRPDPAQPVHTWVTTRMTHVFALAHLQGEPGADALAAHGVRALCGALHDDRYGGWFGSVAPDGTPLEEAKQAYAHAFVLLAATSATAAGVPGAGELLAEATSVVEDRFLDERGRVVDGWDRTFTRSDPYRGANSSMHAVEAFLAAGDVTGDERWHRRALGIAEHLVHQVAAPRDHLLPEHFAEDWTPLPGYNADDPADQFRPFGVTPGHLLEWSRLLLHLDAGLADPPAWLLADSRALFARAVALGWAVDGADGFVYTVDWEGRPVVRHRMHWVHAEGLAAAAALARRTGEGDYARWRAVLEDFCARHLLDPEHGSWHHELDEHNRPSATTWQGKPDVYHAYQALLLAERPLAPCLAVQLAGPRPG